MPLEYKVVSAPGGHSGPGEPSDMLVSQVTEAIGQGWRPIGGIGVAHGVLPSDAFYLFQAMTRTTKDDVVVKVVDDDGVVHQEFKVSGAEP